MATVLVTDYHWPTLDIERRILAEIGADLLVAESGDEAELIELAPQAAAILFCWQPVTHAILDAAVNCKIASRYGVGLDNIDLDYATQLGIPVTYVPDYCMEDVSDHAMALLLACARSIPTFDRGVRQGQWNLQAGQPMFRLRDKVLAVIGYGNIGRALVPKAQGFGMQVMAYAPRLPEGQQNGVTITHDLPGLLPMADFVSLHVPLNDLTQHMVNAAFLAQMKPTAYLINTARGGVIDEDALARALRSGQIAGAALDVLTQEPPNPQHPLLQLDKVLITPHAAFSSVEAVAELQEKAARHVVQALRGERPDQLAQFGGAGPTPLPAQVVVMNIEQPAELLAFLRAHGHIEHVETPRVTPLVGGVSNRTVLVEREDGETWVIKQALEKLRVPVDWFSSPERIHREAEGLRWLGKLAPPGTLPAFVFEDHAAHLLAMQAVPQPHANWKTLLLDGQVDPDHVTQFAILLATIYQRAHHQREQVAPVFADTSFLELLRLEPYYAYTATQVPAAADFLHALIADTRACRITLVHGDYSPKNILVYAGRLILLDHEVIHWGDPAFDLGFSLTHLLSKAHHLADQRPQFRAAARLYWRTYVQHNAALTTSVLEARAARHTLACLLARVAGRSPLEYLSATEHDAQQSAVVTLLTQPPATILNLIDAFLERL